MPVETEEDRQGFLDADEFAEKLVFFDIGLLGISGILTTPSAEEDFQLMGVQGNATLFHCSAESVAGVSLNSKVVTQADNERILLVRKILPTGDGMVDIVLQVPTDEAVSLEPLF